MCSVTELLLAAIPRFAGRHPSHIPVPFHVMGNKTMCRRQKPADESRKKSGGEIQFFLNWGIIARSSDPTSSIRCSSSARVSALKTGLLTMFSRIHSLANSPDWIS